MTPGKTPKLFESLLGGGEGRNIWSSDQLLRTLLLVICYMLIAGGAFIFLSLLAPLIGGALNALTPFILAFILAYVLNPVLRSIQERFHLTRPGVVLITYVLFGGVVLMVSIILGTLVYQQGQSLFLSARERARERETAARLAMARESVRAHNALGDIELLGDEETSGTLELEEGARPKPASTSAVLVAAVDAATSGTAPLEQLSMLDRLTKWAEDASDKAVAQGASWWHDFTSDSRQMRDSLGTMRTAAATTTSVASTIGGYLAGIVMDVISISILVSFVVVICFYMLIDYGGLVESFWRLVPVGRHERVATVLARIDYSLGGFLRGQILICVILGCVWTTWLYGVMGLHKYALLVGFVAGLFNFVPYLGPAIGCLATCAYVLLDPAYSGASGIFGGLALGMAGFGMVQALEGFVLQPKLIGSKAQLHPLLIIFSLVAGGQLGFAGLLLAVPAACIARVLWLELFWHPYMNRQVENLPEDARTSFAGSAMRVFEETQRKLDDFAEVPIGGVAAVRRAREHVRRLDERDAALAEAEARRREEEGEWGDVSADALDETLDASTIADETDSGVPGDLSADDAPNAADAAMDSRPPKPYARRKLRSRAAEMPTSTKSEGDAAAPDDAKKPAKSPRRSRGPRKAKGASDAGKK